jgi:NitT/TauT family transport system substrate-binding protein
VRLSKPGLGLAGIVLTAVLITGCASTPTSNPTSTGATEVTLLKGGSLDFAPIFVAAELGFFEEEDIDATLKPASAGSTADVAALLVSGEYTLGPSNVGDLGRASLQNIPLQMIVSLATVGGAEDRNNAMIVKDGGPDSIGELGEPGNVLGISGGETGVLGTLTRYAIDQDGGDSAAVMIQAVPFPQVAETVLNDTVVGGPLIQPFLTRAEATPGVKNIGSVTAFLAADSPQVGLAANKQWIEDNPAAVAGVQGAITRAVEWIEDTANAEEFLGILSTYLELDTAVLEKLTMPHYSATMDSAAVQDYLDIWTDYGSLPSSVKAEDVVLDGAFK